jgi:hypothetical protein
MAKMKSVQSLPNGRTVARLTNINQFQALVTLISFLNAIYSNFLNGIFIRPACNKQQISVKPNINSNLSKAIVLQTPHL